MNALAGVGSLMGLILRRERVALPLWTGLLVLMVVATAHRYAALFPSAELQVAFARELTANRAVLAFGGQIPSPTLAGLIVFKLGDTLYTLAGLMAALLVLRHTRAEEERGRLEWLGAGAVGRLAPLTAALLVAGAASAVTGLLAALGLIALGFPPAGSMAFGLGIAAPGWTFAAVAALAAQLSASARTASLLAALLLGPAVLLRFLADGSGLLWLRWASLTGWSHLIEPYGHNRWWVALLPAVAALLLSAAAAQLAWSRDLGAGLWPGRPGPDVAAPALCSPLALAWRLQRGLLFGWALGLGLAALLGGVLAGSLPSLAGELGPQVQEFFRRYSAGGSTDLTQAYLWLIALT